MERTSPETLVIPRVKQTDIPTGTIKPRHLEIGTAAVKFGNSSERPEDGSIYPLYFSLDTNILSVWNGSAWVSSTFS